MTLDVGTVAALTAAIGLAGVVRGFSGVGTGLVFMPIALLLLTPPQALFVLCAVDMIGGLSTWRGAWRVGAPATLVPMIAGMLAGLAPGFAVLLLFSPQTIRWAVTVIALVAVVALASGWRWRGSRGTGVRALVGGVSGMLSSSTGLGGPPVMLFWLSATDGAARIRANAFLYFLVGDLAVVVGLTLTGQVQLAMLVLSAGLVVPFLAANWLGGQLFRMGVARFGDRVYRNAALAIIAASAIAGLPLWR